MSGMVWSLRLGLAGLFGLAVLMLFSERLFLADLVQHARAHLALLALLCLGAALVLRRRLLALAALAVAALLGAPAVDSTLPQGWPGARAFSLAGPQEPDLGPRRLTLVAANVYIDNAAPEAMVETLLETDADVLLLIEFRKSWRALADRLDGRYPHSWTHGDITVWSRYPAAGRDATARKREHTLDLVLDVAGRDLRLLATHAPRAPGIRILEERNWLFSEFGAWAREKPLPTVIAGDFNATPWTPALRRLIEQEGLARARPVGGWYGSWPAPLADLGVPIDHLLHSVSITVEKMALLTVPGSDHRAIEATLSLP
jgi:endonuclease/exonuclease/phosphatase (EEP) superfamily protein YafD